MNLDIIKGRVSLIPLPYKILAVVLLFISYTIYVFMKGVSYQEGIDAIHAQKEQAAAFRAGQKAAEASQKVVDVYHDKIITIEKRVPVYVTKTDKVIDDSINVNLPPDVIRLLDQSLQNDISYTPFGTNEEAKGSVDGSGSQGNSEDLRTVMKSVEMNNAICRENYLQVEALQDWIVRMQKLYK